MPVSLLTGASGFVGSALARSLLKAGHHVRVLLRPASDRRNLQGLDVEPIEGDLREPESLVAAVDGCHYLFHAAADYRLWVPEPASMYRSNVDGTRALMQAALHAGIERVVYTSSVATLGTNADGSPADEETPSRLEQMIGHYKRSKFLAEQLVQQMINKDGLPAVIVNPSAPIGPRDIKPTPTGRIVVDTLHGRMPAYVDTGLNIAHVDDIAQGHLLALDKGVVGQRYILGGDNLGLRELFGIICEQVGIAPPRLKLPHALVLPVAWCMEQFSRFSGTEPVATVDGVRMARKRMYFSSAKACAQLGYQSRDARLAVADAVQWFRDNGY